MLEGLEAKLVVLHTLHGTWGRGFIPRDSHPQTEGFWFEERSEFCRTVVGILSKYGYSVQVKPVLWSGSNSIAARDEGAKQLVRAFQRTANDQPDTLQVIIAHSHGGNVLLRCMLALAQSAQGAPHTYAVTLGTPFLQFLVSDFTSSLRSTASITLTMALALFYFAYAAIRFLAFDPALGAVWWAQAATAAASILFSTAAAKLIGFRSVALLPLRRSLLLIETAAGLANSPGLARGLAIRGVDDEAGLALGGAAIIAKLSSLMAQLAAGWLGLFVFWIPFGLLSVLTALFMFLPAAATLLGAEEVSQQFYGFVYWLLPGDNFNIFVSWLVMSLTAFMWTFPLLLIGLIILINLAKAGFARELAVGSLGIDIAANSVPDNDGRFETVTLPPIPSPQRSLRHALYSHPDCARTVANWIASLR